MLLFPFICDTSINLNFHGSPKNKKNRTVTRFRNATHSVESPLLYRCEAKSRSSTYSFFILLCVSRAVVMNHRSGGKCAHDYSLVNK